MSERSTINANVIDGLRIRNPSSTKSQSRIGNSLRIDSQNTSSDDTTIATLSKKSSASITDQSIAANYKLQSRLAEQTIRNSAIGEDILDRANSILEELQDITEKQLSLIESVTNRTTRQDLREKISEEVAALSDRFNETVYNSQYNSGQLFDKEFSINIGNDNSMEFSVGDLLHRFKNALSGVDDSTEYTPTDPGSAQVVRFDFTADSGIEEEYEITFSDANHGGAVGDGTFETPTSFYAGDGATEVKSGDINNDGIADLVVANSFESTVGVLIGIGDGTYASVVSYSSGTNPLSLELADFNGDGNLDLVSADAGADSLTVRLGDGSGTFGAATSFVAGDGPASITVGDFNGDGELDIASAERYTNTVGIFYGNGDGSFLARVSYATQTLPDSIASGDFNGDGDLDLVTVDSTSNVISVFMNDGTGTFLTGVTYANSTQSWSVDVGDVNGDGDIDIVTSGRANDEVSIFLGAGDGTFGARTSVTVGDGPSSVTLGDFNGDGELDIVAADSYSDTVSVLINQGAGSFGVRVTYAVGDYPDSILADDLNGDGVLDLATANANSDNISVLLGGVSSGGGTGAGVLVSDGTYQAVVTYAEATDNQYSVASGDFNEDGIVDLVVGERDQAVIRLGNGDGSFSLGFTVAGGSKSYVNVADFNEDGNLDLAVTDNGAFDNTAIKIYLGNGDGTFNAGLTNNVSATAGLEEITFADFNEDGNVDIVVGHTTSGTYVMIGNGNGTFQARIGAGVPYAGGDVATGDMNGDGNVDVISIYGSNLERWGVSFGTGSGTFSGSFSFDSGQFESLKDLAVGDVDEDGDLDVAISTDNSITIFEANGDGTFLAPVSTLTYSSINSLQMVDIDGDNDLDFLTGAGIMHGRGDGTFGAYRTFSNISAQKTIAVDVTSDGVLDIVSVGDSKLGIIEGNTAVQGTGFFENGVANISAAALKATTGDVNGDNIADILLQTSSTAIEVRLGNGDGTFSVFTSVGVNSNYDGTLKLSDMDNDGELDIVLTESGTHISVIFGNGDGTFGGKITSSVYSSGGADANYFELADFDQDGTMDVISTNPSNMVVSLGNGDGTFSRFVIDTASTTDGPVVVGDFDGDSDWDVAAIRTDGIGYHVTIGLGNGDGTFFATKTVQVGDSFYPGNHVSSITLGDMNGDNEDDIVLGSVNSVHVILGNGDATFKASMSYSSSGVAATTIDLADVNDDGELDVITNGAQVLLGNADGSLKIGRFNETSSNILVGDLTNDGIEDIVTLGANFEVFVGKNVGIPDGTFNGATSFADSSDNSVNLGDFNGDGILDMMGYYSDAVNGTALSVRLGAGDGTFGTATTYHLNSNQFFIEDQAVADLNNDGILDVVTIGRGTGANIATEFISFGNSNGTFKAATSYVSSVSSSSVFYDDVNLVDLNGDDVLDIVTTGDYLAGHAFVRLGNSNGTFKAQATYDPNTLNYGDATLDDMNKDGKIDLVISGTDASSNPIYSILYGAGDGTFSSNVTFSDPSFLGVDSIAVQDVNQDGLLDIIGAGNSTLTVSFADGSGNYSAAVSYGTGLAGPAELNLSDINSDGILDAVIGGAQSGDGKISILFGNRNGSFNASNTYATNGSITNDFALGDLDNDGALDIVTAGLDDSLAGEITVLLGRVEGESSGSTPSLETNDTITIYVPGDNYGADPEKELTFVFSVDGENPTTPGTRIDILSTDNADQIATKVAAAITAHTDADYITATANSPSSGKLTLSYGTGINAGLNVTDTVLNIGSGFSITKTRDGQAVDTSAFTRFYDGTTNYDLYFTVDGVGAAPGGGGNKIQVAVNSTDTLEEILDAAVLAVSSSTGGNFTATHDGTRLTVTRTVVGAPSGAPTTHSSVGDGAISATVVTVGTDPTVGSGGVDAGSDTIELLGHSYNTGDAITLVGDGDLAGGLEEGVTYYIIKVDNDNVKLATSAENAANGIAIDITSSGSNRLTFIGQDGSATYGSGSISYNLTSDPLARISEIEANLQAGRVKGEFRRLNTLTGGFQAFSNVAKISSDLFKKQGDMFNAERIEKDASALTKGIRNDVEEALGTHYKLNHFKVLELLKEDEEEE